MVRWQKIKEWPYSPHTWFWFPLLECALARPKPIMSISLALNFSVHALLLRAQIVYIVYVHNGPIF